MDVTHYSLIGFLAFVIIVGWIELSDKDKTIERQSKWIQKAKEKLGKQKNDLLNYRSKQLRFSQWQSKAEIMEEKGWSESQFSTMMWALKKEGYAKCKGRRDKQYSIMEKKCD